MDPEATPLHHGMEIPAKQDSHPQHLECELGRDGEALAAALTLTRKESITVAVREVGVTVRVGLAALRETLTLVA